MIRVGPAGWSYPDWEGTVYPRTKPRGFHGLAYLSRFVSMIEINSSFYALPRSEHAQRWTELVAHSPDFRFIAKVHQDFTHTQRPLAELDRELAAFHSGVEPMRSSGKLSGLLAQFPFGFRRDPTAVRRLTDLRARFDRVPLILELRHREWFVPESIAHITGLGCSLSAIDLPPSSDHPPLQHPIPGPIGYLRLHGRNSATWFARDSGRDQKYDYLYTPREIDELAERAQRLAGEHDQTFVVTNNHFEGKAVANALELLAKLTGQSVAAPRQLVERYPRLATIARPDGEALLF